MVASGHLLDWLGEPLGALLGFALVASLATVFTTYLLGRELFGRRAGLVAAALVCATPLFLYYAGIVSSYPAETALAPVVALLAHRVATRGDARSTVLLLPAVALVGGFRPSAMPLLLPLCLIALYAGRPRLRALLASVLAAAAVMAAWAAPMVAKSGGLAAYRRASDDLWARSGEGSLLTGGSLGDTASTFAITAFAFASIAAPALVAVTICRPWRPAGWRALAGRLRESARGGPGSRWLLLVAWVVPYLTVYALVHFGKPGYALAFMPAVNVAAGGVLAGSGRAPAVATALAAAVTAGYALLPTPPLPGRAAVFWPTADSIRTQDEEARALQQLSRACRPPRCAIVSLETSRRYWFHDPKSLAEWYAPGSLVVADEALATRPFGGELVWIGSSIPAHVRRRARFERRAGSWVVYRSLGRGPSGPG